MTLTRFALLLGTSLLAAQGVMHASASPAVPADRQGHAAAPRLDPLPARRDGLWELTLRSHAPGPQKPIKVLQCTSAEAERYMLTSVMSSQENCRQIRVQRSGRSASRSYDIQTVCYVHDHRVDGHMRLTGDLQSAYRGQFSVQVANEPQRAASPTTVEGRWLGACRPGQRPGDMVLPSGITVNVVDDMRRAEGRPPHANDPHHGHDHHPHDHTPPAATPRGPVRRGG